MHNYVVVRSDLSRAQQVIQALHAAFCAQAVRESDDLVFLVAPNEGALKALVMRLNAYGVRALEYHEDESLTAAAFRLIQPSERNLFADFRTWKP